MIPVLLVAITLYLILRPKAGFEDTRARMGRMTFYVLFGLGLGFYDGFFGPGTGSFWAMAFMVFLGFNMTRATGYTKVMNFTSNLFALLVFIIGGHVHYAWGAMMAVGQLVGAWLGAQQVIQRGTRFIRPVFLAVVSALTLKLVYDGFFAGR